MATLKVLLAPPQNGDMKARKVMNRTITLYLCLSVDFDLCKLLILEMIRLFFIQLHRRFDARRVTDISILQRYLYV